MTETKSALPAGTVGTEITRFNALKHGVLSRYTVLPWEDAEEYRALLAALAAEHTPLGPTEEHLVEELAGILWRKRRLRLAEAASFRRGLDNATSPLHGTARAALSHLGKVPEIEQVADAIRATPDDTAEELADLEKDQAMTGRAREVLWAGRPDAYSKALAALRKDTREWWEEVSAADPDQRDGDEESYTADAAGLLQFLEGEVWPWYMTQLFALENRPLICSQAFGEALDPGRLERLARYEVHLDRKLERTLAMLIRLKDLRRTADPG